jgi:hypothetical protein
MTLFKMFVQFSEGQLLKFWTQTDTRRVKVKIAQNIENAFSKIVLQIFCKYKNIRYDTE